MAPGPRVFSRCSGTRAPCRAGAADAEAQGPAPWVHVVTAVGGAQPFRVVILLLSAFRASLWFSRKAVEGDGAEGLSYGSGHPLGSSRPLIGLLDHRLLKKLSPSLSI